jgi:hypothetical protein
MDERTKQLWLSPRALRLHAVILMIVPGFMALCVWQIERALGGNTLSWAYVFEWPIFAAYAVYMWWRLLHETAQEDPAPSSATGSSDGQDKVTPNDGSSADPAGSGKVHAAEAEDPTGTSPLEGSTQDDALAAYNIYLARLAEHDRARGR